MPVKKDYTLVRVFHDKREFVQFRQDEIPKISIDHTSYSNCTVCNNSGHKMKIQYACCANPSCVATGSCPKDYKIQTCLKYQSDSHMAQKLKFSPPATELPPATQLPKATKLPKSTQLPTTGQRRSQRGQSTQVSVPITDNTQVQAEKRKRGRPTLASKALEYENANKITTGAKTCKAKTAKA